MTGLALSSGELFLAASARQYFEGVYAPPKFYEMSPLASGLDWSPALRFVLSGNVNVFVEPSENAPFPVIFRRRHSEILQYPEPISVYSVCPEEAALRQGDQAELKRMLDLGFGLITVSATGDAYRQKLAVPLVQVISTQAFRDATSKFPQTIKRRVNLAFEAYQLQPTGGVTNLTEVVESLVVKARDEAINKNFVTRNDAGATVAAALDALYDASQFKNARAAIGGARSYISEYRNLSHHFPRNKAEARKKFVETRHAFLEGLKLIPNFRKGMKNAGLTGNLPPS